MSEYLSEKAQTFLKEARQTISNLPGRPLRGAMGRAVAATAILLTLGVGGVSADSGKDPIPTPKPAPALSLPTITVDCSAGTEKVVQGNTVSCLPAAPGFFSEDTNPLTWIIPQSRMDPAESVDPYYDPTDTVPNDPIFKAASIRLKNIGTASLIEEVIPGASPESGPQLFLLTAGHVGRLAYERNGSLTNYYIPGIGEGKMINQNIWYSGLETVNNQPVIMDDEYVVYALGKHNSNILKEAINKGLITPLHFNHDQVNLMDDSVMQKYTVGQYIHYKINGWDPGDHTLIVNKNPFPGLPLEGKNFDGLGNCQGDSGSALLREQGNKVLPEILGVLIGGTSDSPWYTEPYIYNRKCYLSERIRTTTPFNTPVVYTF